MVTDLVEYLDHSSCGVMTIAAHLWSLRLVEHV